MNGTDKTADGLGAYAAALENYRRKQDEAARAILCSGAYARIHAELSSDEKAYTTITENMIAWADEITAETGIPFEDILLPLRHILVAPWGERLPSPYDEAYLKNLRLPKPLASPVR